MQHQINASLVELDRVVSYLNEHLCENEIIFLCGDLASGKTTLTQAIAQSKGVEGEVTSPTFSLEQCYTTSDGKGIYHYDLYRLEYEAFMQMGLFEEFEKQGWHLIEWGSDRLKIFLEGVGYRIVTIDIEVSHLDRVYRIEI